MNPQLMQNILIYILFIWTLFWKGTALWRAAQLHQRNWFIALIILNTAGLLEIIYLFKFAKNPLTLDEIKTWKNIFVKKVPEKTHRK